MATAILYRMQVGFPGAPNRLEQCTIVPELFDQTTPPTAFGIPVKLVSGKIQPIASGDTVASVQYGLLVRPYPISSTSSEAINTATPDKASIANVMRRGYMTVRVNASLPSAIPAKNRAVYVRKTDHGASEYPIGGIESDADSGKCEVLTGAKFTGAMDANGYCEIEFNI